MHNQSNSANFIGFISLIEERLKSPEHQGDKKKKETRIGLETWLLSAVKMSLTAWSRLSSGRLEFQ